MTNTKPTRHPLYFTDQNGTTCVQLPLANNQGHAELYADDLAALVSCGVSTNWTLNYPSLTRSGGRDCYVQCHVPTSYRNKNGNWTAQVVARLIMQAGAGERVRYVDRNTLNLRRDNLYLTSGAARRNYTDLLPAANEDSGE